jgi:hypothetical protein
MEQTIHLRTEWISELRKIEGNKSLFGCSKQTLLLQLLRLRPPSL